jgi:hypothetical protein
MRGAFFLVTSIALVGVAIVAGSAAAASRSSLQSQPAQQAVGVRLAQNASPGAPPAPAAPQPYKAVTFTVPAPTNDPSFDAFRKELADIAKRKDRSALTKIIAAGFFWEGESGDKADKNKSGIDNLAVAIELDGKEAAGWDVLGAAALEPTLEPFTERKGVMCGPASPQFDDKAFDELTKATQTDMSEWAFSGKSALDVRSAAQPNAPVIDKLGLILIRVMPEEPPADAKAPPPFMRIVTPAGKVGYVAIDSIKPVVADQMCYVKDGNSWKIAGYLGGQ